MKNLIVALGMLLLFSFVSPDNVFAQPKQKHFKQNFKENIIEKLNLTEEQKDKLSELRTNHMKEMVDIKADLQKSLIDMRELNRNSDLSRADLISQVEKINSIKNHMALAKANHKMDVFEMLNDEQKKIWQEHKPFRDHMKMKFKQRSMGMGEFGLNEFDPEPFIGNDDDDDSDDQ